MENTLISYENDVKYKVYEVPPKKATQLEGRVLPFTAVAKCPRAIELIEFRPDKVVQLKILIPSMEALMPAKTEPLRQ